MSAIPPAVYHRRLFRGQGKAQIHSPDQAPRPANRKRAVRHAAGRCGIGVLHCGACRRPLGIVLDACAAPVAHGLAGFAPSAQTGPKELADSAVARNPASAGPGPPQSRLQRSCSEPTRSTMPVAAASARPEDLSCPRRYRTAGLFAQPDRLRDGKFSPWPTIMAPGTGKARPVQAAQGWPRARSISRLRQPDRRQSGPCAGPDL